jgi:hypothetical protein
MLELGIFCVVLFAVGYWTTLFIMGRRDDVLHGEFLEGEPELTPAAEAAPIPFPAKPPSRPLSVAVEPADAAAPARAPAAVVTFPAPQAAVARTPASNERLQSLLVSIKRELKNAAQI